MKVDTEDTSARELRDHFENLPPAHKLLRFACKQRDNKIYQRWLTVDVRRRQKRILFSRFSGFLDPKQPNNQTNNNNHATKSFTFSSVALLFLFIGRPHFPFSFFHFFLLQFVFYSFIISLFRFHDEKRKQKSFVCLSHAPPPM